MDKQAKDLIDPQIRHKAPCYADNSTQDRQDQLSPAGTGKREQDGQPAALFHKTTPLKKNWHGEMSLTMPYCIGSCPCLPLRPAGITPFRQEKRERGSRLPVDIPTEFVPSPPGKPRQICLRCHSPPPRRSL